MTDNIEELIKGHRDAVSVRRVFGEPYQQNGVTIIPAAKVMGGGGGGAGESPDGRSQGSGSGFGLSGRPAGAFIVRGDEVKWQSAVDVNRVITGAFTLGALALLMLLRQSRER